MIRFRRQYRFNIECQRWNKIPQPRKIVLDIDGVVWIKRIEQNTAAPVYVSSEFESKIGRSTEVLPGFHGYNNEFK